MAQGNTFFYAVEADERTEGVLMATGGDRAQARVSVAHYSADEVIRQFLALYNCMDFRAELDDLGVSRFQFMLRGKVLREFRALCIALWGLALTKSFPYDAGDFFAQFQAKAPMLADGSKDAAYLQNRVNIYIDLLTLKKDADFLPVADYMTEALALNPRDLPRMRLKLSLVMRNLYTLIFNKLV